MNPDTNKFEQLIDCETKENLIEYMKARQKLQELETARSNLIRPDGSPVLEHWSVFQVGEKIVIKNYTFEIAHIGEKHMLVEPVGPVLVSEE